MLKKGYKQERLSVTPCVKCGHWTANLKGVCTRCLGVKVQILKLANGKKKKKRVISGTGEISRGPVIHPFPGGYQKCGGGFRVHHGRNGEG